MKFPVAAQARKLHQALPSEETRLARRRLAVWYQTAELAPRRTQLTFDVTKPCAWSIFLGCDSDAPRWSSWDEKSPAFYVADPTSDELERVRSQLRRIHIRYLGSHQGCGCGFRKEYGYLVEKEGDDARAEAADHAALVAYLEALPKEGRPLQIFGCWSGDESEEVLFHRECSIAELADPAFAFREREIITLRR